MKKVVKIFILIIVVIASLIGLLFLIDYLRTPRVIHDFSKLELNDINKLMIVAHPDDEMIWGGSRLIQDDYLVVCVTCGTDIRRVKEFDKVMKKTNDKYVMLGYPDKTNGERDNWESVRKNINKDIKEIIELKNWDLIVTHNPAGEYGHIHHKMTNQIVTSNVENKDKLYYFGKYYSKKRSAENVNSPKIDDDLLIKKIDILKLYKTQIFIMTSFDQMYEYENWLSYNDWKVDV